VLVTPDVVASQFPGLPVFDNAVLRGPGGLAAARALYPPGGHHALWTDARDEGLGAQVRAAGYVRDTSTTAMVLALADAPPPAGAGPLVEQVDRRVVTTLNALPDDLLDGVPDLVCFATADRESGLALQICGDDAVVSFVATRPRARRRGLARAVLTAALANCRDRGLRGAVLQATDEAVGLYAGAGFVPVVRWQEWVPG
jgi:GNAT superfamily N-acetyltransferase